jgi:cytoskeleton protein RodZ
VVSLDSEQLEQLKSIGTFLGEVREEEGRTLEDIATKTYIPLRLLKAIEAGQAQALPEPVFVQGFIRRYGDALGLDGNELSKRFPVNVVPVTSAFTATQGSRTLSDPEPSAAYVPSAETVWQPAELPRSRPPYLLFGGVAVVALAALLFGIILPNLKPSQPIANSPPPTQAIEPAPIAPPAPSPATSKPATPSKPTTAIASPVPSPAPTGAVAIDVNVTDESWIEVLVDGKVAFEGILEKGTKRSWSGKEAIRISSGNAGAVAVSFNKGTAKKMGALGAIEEKTYTTKTAQ